MDKIKISKKQKNNIEKTFNKNIKFLSTVDIEKYIKNIEKQKDDLAILYFELFEALEFDDSIIFEYANENIDTSKIKEGKSIVEKFAASDKFLTLMERHKETIIEIFGKDTYKSKQQLLDRKKWNKVKKDKWS